MKLLVRVATLTIVAILVVAMSACSGMLKLNKDVSEDRDDIRATFLQNNPDGKHNDHIKKGEVVKGMSVIEVLASWGLPDMRRVSKQTDAEFWSYFTVDQYSEMVSSYDLVFEDRVLNRWIIAIDAMSLEDFHKGKDFTESDRLTTRQSGGLSSDSGSLTKRP